MMRLVAALLMVCATLLPAAASAHALDPGYLDVSSLGQDHWRVTWRVPDVDGRPMPIEVRLPGTCSQETAPAPAFDLLADHVAAISAAVYSVIGAHRIVRIEEQRHGEWVVEGRLAHHTSHAVSHHSKL